MPRVPPLPLELPAIRDKDSDFFDLDRFRLCERLPIKPARDRDRCAVTWGRVRPEIRPDWVDSFVRKRNVRGSVFVERRAAIPEVDWAAGPFF